VRRLKEKKIYKPEENEVRSELLKIRNSDNENRFSWNYANKKQKRLD
jgi:hypothetical protein